MEHFTPDSHVAGRRIVQLPFRIPTEMEVEGGVLFTLRVY
jgi:hypothetical protein